MQRRVSISYWLLNTDEDLSPKGEINLPLEGVCFYVPPLLLLFKLLIIKIFVVKYLWTAPLKPAYVEQRMSQLNSKAGKREAKILEISNKYNDVR